MATKDHLKLVKATKYIEVYQYNGYFGGFAQHRQLLWRCVVVGANGERRFGGDWMQEGHGNPNKMYAKQQAAAWSAFTGWPVRDLGRVPQYDDAPKDERIERMSRS